MYAEAIVIFNPEFQERSDYLQKRTLQLFSKMRFLSAQYIPFFQNNLWHPLAHHANIQAQKLGKLIAQTKDLHISYPVKTNQIFFTAPPALIPLIQKQIACHLWDQEKHQLRLVTSWCTTDDDVEAAGKILKKIL